MICHAFQAGVTGRLHLLYSARTAVDFAYLTEMKRYAREGRLDLALNATREIPTRWKGRRGRITRDQLVPLVEDPATLCFVCGPATMVDEVPRMLMEIGIEPARIRVEEW
jgi:ferredoxin-NADP reductase